MGFFDSIKKAIADSIKKQQRLRQKKHQANPKKAKKKKCQPLQIKSKLRLSMREF